MVLTCLQCQGHSLHLQCQQVCSRTPARFVSVNGACSWSSLHLPFVNVITGFENRHYLLVTDVPYNSSSHERSWCAFLFPSLHYPVKVLLKLLSLGYCSRIKNWHGTDTLRFKPTGRKREGGPEPCARQVLVQGICSQVPGCIRTCCGTVPVSWGDQGDGAANTAFLFLSKSLSSLSLTILSEVSLHSDFKFRQICHWL